ncbi:M28 family peptidase [Pontibacter sp. KCTC 32443]|uniref:M28 family peptidase n=1 Tax=Pontibacter TaxID=323449 RepID=UPI00164D8846|nr:MULTISPECIES: M28 family peptidase [Pontibacter]MBC5773078.1 M28 family peptidase [Pontibacter sp. KCTC 32443]
MKANTRRLYADVEFLTSQTPPRNYRNLGTLEEAARYIGEEFSKAGAAPEVQKWVADGNEYKNIIASYNPQKNRRLIVGAHYDVCGDQPGADDNASAVAGLLELARLTFAQQPELDYRIDFLAYCLEEPPYYATGLMGSYIHARSLHDDKVDVIGMICLEMIGYFSDEPESQPFPSPELAKLYPHVANFIIVVGIEKYAAFNNKVHQLMSEDSGIDVQVIHFPVGEGLAGMSDQRNYWKFGYKALMINDSSFIRNPNYHMPTDTIETLDFAKMTEVVNSTYKAITNIL